MKNQLNTRKSEVIAAQEKLVKAAMEAKAWSPAQETEYAANCSTMRHKLCAHGDVQRRAYQDLLFVARFSFWKPHRR
jgi:hypothetical protein